MFKLFLLLALEYATGTSPIMLALCLMLSLAYYANNNASIIDSGLLYTATNLNLHYSSM